jgi:hypothetical protein
MKKSPSISNAGGITILMVFAVLCLSIFGILSVTSSLADLRLSRRAAAYQAAYYEADLQAQELLSSLEEQLHRIDAACRPEPYNSFASPEELAEYFQRQLSSWGDTAGLDGDFHLENETVLGTFRVSSGTCTIELQVRCLVDSLCCQLEEYRMSSGESGALYEEDPLPVWGGE